MRARSCCAGSTSTPPGGLGGVDVEAARRVALRALPRDLAKAERDATGGEPHAGGAATASAPLSPPVIDRAGLDVVADGTRPPGETCARVLAKARRGMMPA